MAYNQSNSTADPQPLPIWPVDPVFGVQSDACGVVREAHAVEREARALEREAGGWPFVGATFQDLSAAVQMMIDWCRALPVDELDDQQRQFVADIRARLAAIAAEIADYPPAAPTFQTLLAAAQDLKETCTELQGVAGLDDEQRQFLSGQVAGAIDSLIANIQDFIQRSRPVPPGPPSTPATPAPSGKK